MKELAEARRRSLMFSLLIIVVFELIDSASIADLQLGPLKVTRLSLVQEALPVLFSYLMYDIIVLSVRYSYAEQVCVEIIKKLHGSLSRTGLDQLLLPFHSSLFGPGMLPGSARERSRSIKMIRTIYIIAPYLLIVYMFTRNVIIYGFHDLLLWISAAVSVTFFIAAIVVFRKGRRTIDRFP
jgi:hypothetical protein